MNLVVVEGGFFMVFVVACVREQHLVVADAGGLHALLALLGDEGDSLALLKGLEAVLLWWESVTSSKMDEEESTRVCWTACWTMPYAMAQHCTAHSSHVRRTSMARKWTKRSAEPFSGVMKPYPFSSLNHLTVPFWRSVEASILIDVVGWWG